MLRGTLLLLSLATIVPNANSFSSRTLPHLKRASVQLHLSERSIASSPSSSFVKELSQQTVQDRSPLSKDRSSSVLDQYQQKQQRAVLQQQEMQLIQELETVNDDNAEYQRGLQTIGFCTLVFASMSPAMHAALQGAHAPPVLLLNAAVSVVALAALVTTVGPFLEKNIPPPSTLQQQQQKDYSLDKYAKENSNNNILSRLLGKDEQSRVTTIAGLELGLWKFLGTTANLYGLSMTTADHGAFLIQLTTLIVPTVQGIMGVPIPTRIKSSIALALCGVALFTQDHGGATADALSMASAGTQWIGDILCVVAAAFYATYDLRLFSWGKRVSPRQLITSKISTQAALSVLLLLGVGWSDTSSYIQSLSLDNGTLMTGNAVATTFALILWSGVMVNAIVPFLQVGGQQAIGPTRAQTIYASQPLWAAIMSYFFLGETVNWQGFVGGGAFLVALFLAATAEAPSET